MKIIKSILFIAVLAITPVALSNSVIVGILRGLQLFNRSNKGLWVPSSLKKGCWNHFSLVRSFKKLNLSTTKKIKGFKKSPAKNNEFGLLETQYVKKNLKTKGPNVVKLQQQRNGQILRQTIWSQK